MQVLYEMKTEKCPAFGKTCSKCKQENHFAIVCTTLNKPYKPRSLKKKFKRQVKMVDQNDEYSEENDESSSSDKYTYVHAINKESSQNKLFAKVSLNDHLVKFQIDFGATCNIVPISILSSDQANKIDTSKSTVLHMYNGATESTLGELAVKLNNPRTGNKYKLMCSVMDNFHKKVVPIIGYSAAQAMDIIHVNHENICRIESNASHPITKQDILSEFVDVFEGQGLLEGECTLKADNSVTPSIQPPRKVPLHLKGPLKKELDHLEKMVISLRKITPQNGSMVLSSCINQMVTSEYVWIRDHLTSLCYVITILCASLMIFYRK